ncbi:MAG: translation initiation factor IF-2 [Armatimonadetes bacterium]|nr:translation initiation factor IF-2 [Armatimonadota bacterium]
MRVYELAKELGLSTKELVDVLAMLKVPVKSHSSSLSVVAEQRVRVHIAATRPSKGKKQAASPAAAAPPPPVVIRPETKTPTGERILGMRKIVPPPQPVVEPVAPPEAPAVPQPQAVPELRPAAAAPAAPAAAAIPVSPVAPAAPADVVIAAAAPAAAVTPAPVPHAAAGVVEAPPAPPKVVPSPPRPREVKIEPVRPPKREIVKEAPREPAGRGAPPPPIVLPPRVPDTGDRRRPPAGPGKPPGKPAIQPRRPVFRLPRRRRRVRARPVEITAVEAVLPVTAEIELTGPISVGELASRLNVAPGEIVRRMLDQGVLAGINQQIPADMATQVAESLGTVVHRPRPVPAAQQAVQKINRMVVAAGEGAVARPPVVTVMGHVDHGKTTLLDAIRQTRVAEAEFGGITQHIGASVVQSGGREVVFIDTPGHAAFTSLRARGAQVTDVAVLVVAADDGVMPQTVEAVNHARAAGVPIVVAINKMDLPQANPDRVKQGLADLGLVPEEWGGDTIMVPVSARQKTGLDHLIEMILLVSELQDLRADVDCSARGTIIEARLDRGRGPVATVLIQEGRLRVGDAVVAGETHGRVRAMMDARGARMDQATPSTPVEVLGLVEVPQAGDLLEAMRDERIARATAEERRDRRRASEQAAAHPGVVAPPGEGPKELRVIIKGDAHGSVEALQAAVPKLSGPEVKVTVLHAAVGNVTESDIMLASASRAVVVGFNVRPEAQVRRIAEEERVDLRVYRVIYEALDDLAAVQKGLLAPKVLEVVLGQAEVRQVFTISRLGVVAGSYVTGGRVVRGAKARIVRDGVVVYDGRIGSLRRFKEDVREVSDGFECGIGLERFNDVKEGDLVEAYEVQEVPA